MKNHRALPIADDLRVHRAGLERSIGGSLNFSVSPSARAPRGDINKVRESATDSGMSFSGRRLGEAESAKFRFVGGDWCDGGAMNKGGLKPLVAATTRTKNASLSRRDVILRE